MADLVKMANDIANFHAGYPEAQAQQMLAEPLNKFWHRSMRARFHQQIAEDSSVFHPLVVACAGMVKCDTLNPVKVEFVDKHGSGG